MEPKKQGNQQSKGKISLYPLTPEAALKALLETKPEEKSDHSPKSNPSKD